jgi:hypothetical protein
LVDIVDTPGWSTTFRVFLPMRTSVASVASVTRISGPAQPA